MNKEYYTPDISDIRVGYECEFHGMTVGGLLIMDLQDYTKSEMISEPNIEVWYPIKCGYDIWSNEKTVEDIKKLIENNQIRTPYLNKEQIEAEGWEFKDSFNYEDELREIFKKAEFIMEYNYKNNELIIRKGSWYPEETKYQGFCSIINEFKTICKFLKIKNEKL